MEVSVEPTIVRRRDHCDGRRGPRLARVRMLGARRPDVFGYCNVVGAVVAGEAKRGPELWV